MSFEKNKINEMLKQIKYEYEEAILREGRQGVTSLIRSQKLIGHVHEYTKEMLVYYGINPSLIYPPIGQTQPEIPLPGFFKRKSQDICVIPEEPVRKEVIMDGVLKGEETKYTKDLINRSISINIRSQLSSLAKNFDTLFERTFAEAINLHLRTPNLILGEIYLIPLVAYDPNAIPRYEIAWREKLPFKFIPAFSEINGRRLNSGEEYKYERVSLVIVDFRKSPPIIIESMDPLIELSIVDENIASRYSLKELSLRNFVKDLLDLYKERHGSEAYEALLKK